MVLIILQRSSSIGTLKVNIQRENNAKTKLGCKWLPRLLVCLKEKIQDFFPLFLSSPLVLKIHSSFPNSLKGEQLKFLQLYAGLSTFG